MKISAIDSRLTPAHLRLIDALAKKAVEDYLRNRAAANMPSEEERTKPAPLPRYDRAA